ncbi:hypothetical protein RND81_14G223600 [Saponaria officinalis]|uniref:Uncharacterized protein n=1 Tax=Saponaria officinalis TaxID=3572 RepID=A0AAW1GR13_SAPOF
MFFSHKIIFLSFVKIMAILNPRFRLHQKYGGCVTLGSIVIKAVCRGQGKFDFRAVILITPQPLFFR